jgi:hypothetical protein
VDPRDWRQAFIDELVKLRPHLSPGWSASRIAHAIATTEYHPDLEPKVAAQRYHARQPKWAR